MEHERLTSQPHRGNGRQFLDRNWPRFAYRDGRATDAQAPVAVSVVIPVLDEEANIAPLLARLRPILENASALYEIIFVSDGSTDRTCERVADARRHDARIRLIHLSRRFGHQYALQAGLDHASGRVVITMDGDLQHPPEALPSMIDAWRDGADIVHGVRRAPTRQSVFHRWGKRIGYGLLERLCEVSIIPQSADFRLYDRRAARAMQSLRESSRFNRGLARWVGFNQTIVYFDEATRAGGRAKYSPIRLIRLMMDGVFSLSARPLRYMGLVGLGLSALGGLYLAFVLIGHLLHWPGFDEVDGWASLMATVLCMGGVQLVGLWLMSQYLGRTYEEVKRRPLYIVAQTLGIAGADPDEPPAAGRRELPRRAPTGATAEALQRRMEAAALELRS